MKNIRNLFKNKDFLLEEPEVENLITYCEELQDEIVEFNYQKTQNKELALKDMLAEILKACNETQKQQAEATRFGLEAPDFEAAINNLKKYINERCNDERIYL
jgi:peptidoglycan hydrolase CwlO-like protein